MTTTTRSPRKTTQPSIEVDATAALKEALDVSAGNEKGTSPFVRPRRRGPTPRIVDHTMGQLDDAVNRAAEDYGSHFWTLLHGIDAFMERRRRKDRVLELKRELNAALERTEWQS